MKTRINLKNEKHLGLEVARALKFFNHQLKKGWAIQETFSQLRGSYGKRIEYFVLLELKKVL